MRGANAKSNGTANRENCGQKVKRRLEKGSTKEAEKQQMKKESCWGKVQKESARRGRGDLVYGRGVIWRSRKSPKSYSSAC